MKNYTRILVMLALRLLTGCQEEVAAPDQVREFSIASSAYEATYDIKVALPDDYVSSNGQCAVIYVLDGDDNFNFVAQECERLSAKYSTANAIVVSIGYGRSRDMDYTPTKTSSSMGGAPEFMQFIREELVPRMELEFRADTSRSSRVIIGHSFGGLFGAYAFVADNNLFGSHLLLSPSLWFDNEITLQMESTKRSTLATNPQLVFLGVGEMENLGKMQAPIEAFYQVLRDNYSNIHLTKNLEEDLAHMGSRDPNIVKSLEFYFQNR